MVRLCVDTVFLTAVALLVWLLPGTATNANAASSPKVDTDLSLRLAYHSNLFNVPLDREEQFVTEGGPGDRFDGMSGPSDIQMRIEGGASAAWRLAKRRTLLVNGELRYSGYADNTIVNHVRLRTGARLDLTRRDALDLELTYTPDRFKKNYKFRSLLDDMVEREYLPAHYRQLMLRLGYDRQWTKVQGAGLSYRFADRNFDDPFQVRNRTTHALQLHADRRLHRRMTIELETSYAWASTPTEIVLGSTPADPTLARDRSFNEISGEATVKMRLRRGWRANVAVGLARRDFTTDNLADALYHDRTDDSWSLSATLRKKLDRNLTMQIHGHIKRKTSDRRPSAEDAIDEDIGYQGYELGAGVTYTF